MFYKLGQDSVSLGPLFKPCQVLQEWDTLVHIPRISSGHLVLFLTVVVLGECGELGTKRLHIWSDICPSCCWWWWPCCCCCCSPCSPDWLHLSPRIARPCVPGHPDALLQPVHLVGRWVEDASSWARVGVLNAYPRALVLPGYHLTKAR